MICREQWLQQKRHCAKEWFFTLQPPVITHFYVIAIPREYPLSTSIKITESLDDRSVWITRLGYFKLPPDRVWQPSLSENGKSSSNAVRVATLQFFQLQIDRRPPDRQSCQVVHYVCDFINRSFNPP